MKYLSDYMEKAQTELFNNLGAFFAFSNEQFNEAQNEGVKYVKMGLGLFCPKENAIILIEGFDKIHQESIKQDIAENGKDKIILRELHNYECIYKGDPTEAIEVLKDYNFTEEEIEKIYRFNYAKSFD